MCKMCAEIQPNNLAKGRYFSYLEDPGIHENHMYVSTTRGAFTSLKCVLIAQVSSICSRDLTQVDSGVCHCNGCVEMTEKGTIFCVSFT